MGIKIGNKESKYPLIQGGMGVGVSLSNLAGNVSKCGGIGVIAAADIGYKEEDFNKDPLNANLRAIKKEVKKAKEIAGDEKIIACNVMVALEHYEEIVKAFVDAKIDLVISGAGLPLNLPSLVIGSKTKIAPIVSSAKALALIIRSWKKYNYIPDLVIVEGPKAGGHLGFKNEELEDKTITLEKIIKEVLEYTKDYEEKTGIKIPVIAAGGIYTKEDINKYLSLGCQGVQMATRFVTTHECDASLEFKMAYVNAKLEDIKIIKSPVGLPGRALKNDFTESVSKTPLKITKCYHCIKTCNPKVSPYCITKALIDAVKGDVLNSLVFCGENVYKTDKIVKVEELINELFL